MLRRSELELIAVVGAIGLAAAFGVSHAEIIPGAVDATPPATEPIAEAPVIATRGMPDAAVPVKRVRAATPVNPRQPIRIDIPKIDVAAGIVPLGLQKNGRLEVPGRRQDAGWYRFGPSPGENGNAVIAAHSFTRKGAAAFERLDELSTGDLVFVTMPDGEIVIYRVNGIGVHPKADFPSDAVYGHSDRPELRLVTCGGEQDGTRFASNVIVDASIYVPSTPAPTQPPTPAPTRSPAPTPTPGPTPTPEPTPTPRQGIVPNPGE